MHEHVRSPYRSGKARDKLYVHAEPGALDNGRQRDFCRAWRNQTEVAVKGIHFVQEDSAAEIGAAVSDFVRGLRGV
jgi:haloalkane dehalogenase